MMRFKEIVSFLKRNQDKLALFIISITVTSWTLFRFYTKNIIFDQTGQQLLIRQWLSGYTDGSVMAPTNYIVKMLLIYLPFELLSINPKQSLIISTIFVNILTFAAIYYLLKKLLEYFNIPTSMIFNLSMIWLASIAGSVFWIQFTNSRNLEIAAGLLMIYLGLLIYRKYTFKLLIILTGVSTIAFYADPMQLFVTATILVFYMLIDQILIVKSLNKNFLKIVFSLTFSVLISIILTLITKYTLNVEYFSVGSLRQSVSVFSNIDTVFIETTRNTIRLLSGTRELGMWRQTINVFFVICVFSLSFVAFKKNKSNKSLIVFGCLFLAVPIIVYILSGYPMLKVDTSRYLILLAFSIVFIFSASELHSKKTKQVLVFIILVTVFVNIFSLQIGTIKNYRTNFVGEDKLQEKYNFLVDNSYRYGYSAMDTAIPAMYLYGNNDRVLLPLKCVGSTIKKSIFTYDAAVFNLFENSKQDLVPIILDGNFISNYPDVCTKDEIINQLGTPLEIKYTGSGDQVLLYKSDVSVFIK